MFDRFLNTPLKWLYIKTMRSKLQIFTEAGQLIKILLLGFVKVDMNIAQMKFSIVTRITFNTGTDRCQNMSYFKISNCRSKQTIFGISV